MTQLEENPSRIAAFRALFCPWMKRGGKRRLRFRDRRDARRLSYVLHMRSSAVRRRPILRVCPHKFWRKVFRQTVPPWNERRYQKMRWTAGTFCGFL